MVEEISNDMTIKIQGNSKVLMISKECKQLNLKEGDIVRVTIRRL